MHTRQKKSRRAKTTESALARAATIAQDEMRLRLVSTCRRGGGGDGTLATFCIVSNIDNISH
jgi:hypothetical protein